MKIMLLCLSMLQSLWGTDPIDTQQPIPTYTYQDWKSGDCLDIAQIFDIQNPNNIQNRKDFDLDFIKYIKYQSKTEQGTAPLCLLSDYAAQYENIFYGNMKQLLNDHILQKAIDKKIEENNHLSENCKLAIRHHFDNALANITLIQDEQTTVNDIIADITKCADRTKFITYAYIHISITQLKFSSSLTPPDKLKVILSEIITDNDKREEYLNHDKSRMYIGDGNVLTETNWYHECSQYNNTNQLLSAKLEFNIEHKHFPDYTEVWDKHKNQFESCETLVHDNKYDFIRPSDLVDPTKHHKVLSFTNESDATLQNISRDLFYAMEEFLLHTSPDSKNMPHKHFTMKINDLRKNPSDISYNICKPNFNMTYWGDMSLPCMPNINSTLPYSKAYILFSQYQYDRDLYYRYHDFLYLYSSLQLDLKSIDDVLDLRKIFDQLVEYAKDTDKWIFET